MRFLRRIRYYYFILVKRRESPERIARGFAIGVFIAFNPLLGLHTIMCIALAIVMKASKTASILGSLLCNPLTIPFIFFSEYEVGKFFMKMFKVEVEVKTFADFNSFSFEYLIELGKTIAYPLFIGSIVIGAIFSLMAYIFSKLYFERVFSNAV